MIWLDHCEWNAPGSNRSTISIETAVAQQVREDDRAELIRQFNAKAYADRVQIRRDAIVSETIGTYTYSATIRNMNWGAAGVCRDMTRKSWNAADWQGA